MSNECTAIVTAYEDLGMSPEEIAEDRGGMDVTAVKAALMQSSSKYRKDSGENPDLGFSGNDETDCLAVIANIARYGEDEGQRLKAAMFVRNDRRGRLDAPKQMKGTQFNIIDFNSSLSNLRQLADQAKQRVLDVSSTPIHQLKQANG